MSTLIKLTGKALRIILKKFSPMLAIGDEDKDIHNAEKYFRKTIQKAAGKYIPAGRIPKVFNALPREAVSLIEE